MGRILAVYPTLPQQSGRVVLGGAEYLLTFTWRERPASWYVDVYDAAGAALLLGRRLAPQGAPWFGFAVPGLPDGQLFVAGLDGAPRLAMGRPDGLEVVFYAAAEITPENVDPGYVVRL
jgi:hypothetical protein